MALPDKLTVEDFAHAVKQQFWGTEPAQHPTVAEMVRRYNAHAEMVEALDKAINELTHGANCPSPKGDPELCVRCKAITAWVRAKGEA
ncbi:hypothetical protein FJY70_00245 [candidate division WOR-3 bacterium]|nr:hypothetical protein [candidate division WOR-3 bacterium]